MTEQARPLKGIQNRIETLGSPATDYTETTERVREDSSTLIKPVETVERRTILDSLVASGWLNWEKLFWLAIIALAVVTRLWDLAPRAMHHDESIHGVFSNDMFLGRSIYRYDPTWHGPVLYYMVCVAYFLLGGVNEFSVRFAPAMFGIGLIAICWALRPIIGKIGTLAFAVMLLISPSILYYSRSLRHDIFATFGMLLFIIGFFRFAQARAGKSSGTGWMVAAGLGFFILFGSHEMSFINLAMLLVWLGLIFLLELIALPAWIRRRAEGELREVRPLVLAQSSITTITTAKPNRLAARFKRPVLVEPDQDDELDDPDAALSDGQPTGFEEVTDTAGPGYEVPDLAYHDNFAADPAPVRYVRSDGAGYRDPILGRFNLVWPGLFGLFGLLILAGSIHLFTDITYENRVLQFLGVNAYLIFIPFYLLLSAAISYPLALLINYGYNRLSPRSNLLARLVAGGVFVVLTALVVALFMRGKSPAVYLAAVGEKISGTSSGGINALVKDGFVGFTEVSYGGLKWFSILPELVIIAVAVLLLGALVGWLVERRFLVYTERGFYGFGITGFFIMLVSSLVSLRFIMVPVGTPRPKVIIPLFGFIDKWEAYVITGVVIALVVGLVAGWFVSLAELIPDSVLRGSGILRPILRFARQPWSVVALLLAFGIPYILIFSNFFFTPERLADGFYRGIEYWGEQHDKRRLDEPWFYYPLLMLLYEIFAVVMFFIGLVYFPLTWWRRSARRGRMVFSPRGIFIGLTFWWSFFSLIIYSIAGEKIPWLNMQIALPVSLAAACFLNDYLGQINWKRVIRWREGMLFAGLFVLMFAATLVMIGMAINFPRKGQLNAGLNQTVTDADITTAVIQMLLVGLVGLGLFGFSLWLWLGDRLSGQTARAVIMGVASLILLAYTVKSTIALNYGHPDVAIEPMIYTQTSPEVPLVVERLARLSRDLRDTYKVSPPATQPGELPNQYPDPANSKGLPLFVSAGNTGGSGGVDWPLHWYLRDYTNVNYGKINTTDQNLTPLDKLTDARGNNYVMIMVAKDDDTSALQQQLAGQYTAENYRFRWHFPEDDSGYGGLGWQPPNDYREDRLAKKDISNTRWDMILRSFTEQPFAGRLWRYVTYRQLWQPLQSYDMVVYVRNDVYPDFGLTNGTAPATAAANDTTAYDLTASTQVGNRNGQYSTPRNLVVAPAGDVYVLDSLNGRVQHFDKDGKFLSKFGSIGTGDGQFTLQQYQSGPGGICLDDEGNVYVTDTWGYRIEKFDKDGKFLLKWGQGQDISSDPAKAQQFPDSFYGPRSIAYDATGGELFITDTGNKRVVVYDKLGQFKRQFGGKGSGKGQFDEPTALAISPDGKLYVTDLHNRRVQILDKQGQYLGEIAVPSWKDAILSEPYPAFSPTGDLFVSDPVNKAVLRFDKDGKPLATYGADTGLPLLNPVGLAFDPEGNLYIADAKRNAIVKTKP